MNKESLDKYRQDLLAECRDLLNGINHSSRSVCDCCLGYGFERYQMVRIESGQMMCPDCMGEFIRASEGVLAEVSR